MAGSQQEIYTIFCLIVGEDVPFPVKIANNETVGYLKDKIKEKRPDLFATIAAVKLKLYHVTLADNDQLVENVKSTTLATPLRATTRLASISDGTFKEDTVHIIVEPPESAPITANLKRKASSDLEDPDKPLRKRNPRHSGPKTVVSEPTWCPREDTVSGVLELLHIHHLVQVRGTPTSGKTTLMHLLHGRILREYPKAQVFIHKHWPKEELQLMNGETRLNEKLPGYPLFNGDARYFLFDEGQTTYWDTTLWLTFKDDIQSRQKPVYVILFCSYGNGTVSTIGVPTPLAFGDARVTLARTNKGGPKPCGLLLDKEEFCDVIRHQAPKLLLADDLRDFVYQFTRGHVGATIAVIRFLLKKREASMLTGVAYSKEAFDQDTPSFDEFCGHLSMDNGIGRMMPQDLSEYAEAMRTLLAHGSIHLGNKAIDEAIRSKLRESYEFGFIDLNEADRYDFASPLHQQLWSWRLLPQANYPLPFEDLFSFVKATVALFRPSQLGESDRRVNSASHRPPEAQYQEEYYHCVHELTGGNVRISPEYAAAAGSRAGRIDFFIPSKKWGIELTRDGLKLGEHDSRFADDGAYGQWLQSSDMDDYVLLDFRSTMPVKGHPGIRNLYHVVFGHDKTQVEIYDNQLSLQEQRNLMQNHR